MKSFVLGAALFAAASAVLAQSPQISGVQVRKRIGYEQISASDTILRTDGSAYEFRANVFGNNIGSIPAPTVTGPFNVGALGARHNNGVMVYSPAYSAWRWGQGGTDFTTSSRTELDSLFSNGTYVFNIANFNPTALSLTGNAYPTPPRFTLGGGAWVGGAYQLDPAQALTIAASAFVEWGTRRTGDLLSAAGGQTLGGPYSRFPTLSSLGTMTVTFNNESSGMLVWPGGAVPIQRFNIIPNGLNLPAVAGQPENGWWWNEQEAGRGFFMEWQNGWLDIAGYMYDDLGNSV